MATSKLARPITEEFVKASQRPVTQIAFRYNEGGKWHDISWPEYFGLSERVAAGLNKLGVQNGDRVAIMSGTRYQWAVSDLAVLGLGCVTVPIYHSSTAEDASFILRNSKSVVLFVEDQSQLAKANLIKNNCPDLKAIVSLTPVNDKEVVPWTQLLSMGQEVLNSNPNFYRDECRKVKITDMATIVYTSGTTGQPKGAVLLHSNIASECEDIRHVLQLDDKDSTLSFLPFAHIFGRVELWANIYIGWKMGFAESIDRIPVNLTEIKPTFMMAVPRIFEKIYSKIISQVDEGSDTKKKIFKWAVDVGSQVSKCKREQRSIPLSLALQYKLAYKLVFSKLNAKLGGRIRYLVSGGAPLSKEIAEFFHAAGILVLEGYGLTETTAAVTVNTPYKYKFGSVGIPVGDVEVKIANDGEVLIRSGKVFKEYYENTEATLESFTDGWFHTGDIGEIDNNGFLTITDRKKDLIKTAGGKMIAPQKIENTLKTNKFISQALIYGDKMKYLVALITLNQDEITKFAKMQNIEAKSPEDMVKSQKVQELVRDIIREKNSVLASYETVKNFAILPTEFTVENGELTPSMKIKRKYLSQKYQDVIKDLYSGH